MQPCDAQRHTPRIIKHYALSIIQGVGIVVSTCLGCTFGLSQSPLGILRASSHGTRWSIHYDEINIPECPEGWAIIKVKAAGICSSDIARVFTKGTYHFPTIPGHEFSGIVERVGSKKDAAFVGKHV